MVETPVHHTESEIELKRTKLKKTESAQKSAHTFKP